MANFRGKAYKQRLVAGSGQCRCTGAGCWFCSSEREYQAARLRVETVALEDEARELERRLESVKHRLQFLRELRLARDVFCGDG